jgi:hypothetical protein
MHERRKKYRRKEGRKEGRLLLSAGHCSWRRCERTKAIQKGSFRRRSHYFIHSLSLSLSFSLSPSLSLSLLTFKDRNHLFRPLLLLLLPQLARRSPAERVLARETLIMETAPGDGRHCIQDCRQISRLREREREREKQRERERERERKEARHAPLSIQPATLLQSHLNLPSARQMKKSFTKRTQLI